MAGYIGSKASVVSSGAERKKTFAITTSTTSLTGLSYTVDQVHVFHNGVRLVDGTDYTATNGTSITLTSAAENGDEVVVVSYATFQTSDTVSASTGGTFAGDVTFDGSFTSQGIDDNATSTAMTLDASGNLLVGTTDTSIHTSSSDTGIALRDSGSIYATRDGGTTSILNRLTSDGDILSFRKDGAAVGSIGTYANEYYHGSAVGGDTFLRHGYSGIVPATSSGTNRDAAIQLGSSVSRFKDLYLSGGVYLGGTGSANKLEDYEEGTWTPSYPSSWTAESQYANYTKVGRFCYYNAKILVNSTGSGSFYVGGLPFTNGIYAKTHGAQMFEQVTLSTSRTQVVGFTSASLNSHELYQLHSTGGAWSGLTSSNLNSNSEFYIQGVIVTA